MGMLFPPSCLVCDRLIDEEVDQTLICGACRAQLSDQKPACRRCARPLPELANPTELCTVCLKSRFRFDRAVALGVYGDRLRDVVIRMKQTRDEPLALAMGRLLAEKCQEMPVARDISLIVPVPMHWQRRIWGGSNAPELLSETLAGQLGKPLATRLLACRRKTSKQGTLLRTERRKNVRRAYRVTKGYDIRRAHLLLVDDVMTTGATLNEVARTLRRAGAEQISVAVAARGIGFE
jgi:ComF family protein